MGVDRQDWDKPNHPSTLSLGYESWCSLSPVHAAVFTQWPGPWATLLTNVINSFEMTLGEYWWQARSIEKSKSGIHTVLPMALILAGGLCTVFIYQSKTWICFTEINLSPKGGKLAKNKSIIHSVTKDQTNLLGNHFKTFQLLHSSGESETSNEKKRTISVTIIKVSEKILKSLCCWRMKSIPLYNKRFCRVIWKHLY